MSRRPPDSQPCTVRMERREWSTFASCCRASRSPVGAAVARCIETALFEQTGEFVSIEKDCDRWSAAIQAASHGADSNGYSHITVGYGVIREVVMQVSAARFRRLDKAMASYRAPYKE